MGENETLTPEVLQSIYDVMKKHVPIVFVTGRGESGLKNFVNLLIDKLKEEYNISSDLLKNIIGVSNNGNFLFYTSGQDESKYLDVFHNLIDEESLQKLWEFNNDIINEDSEKIKENYITYSYCKSLNNKLTGIRIIVTDEKKLEEIEKYVKDRILTEKYKEFLKYDIGKFKGNIIIQIGTSTKGNAIEEVEKFLGIPKDSILRIGSSGQANGSDYEMLQSSQGFSINKYSQYKEGCFPIFDDEGNLLKGVDAIQFLLKKLNIFPTVCLEKPNKKRYVRQLAIAEKNINAGRSESFNRFNEIFNENFGVTGGFNDVFDKKSGGLFFKDWEWELLSSDNKLKELFEIKDNGKYKYMIDTDEGKLLRGSDTYYYFLTNKGKGKNITQRQIFEWWKNNSIFIKEIIYILKDYKITSPEDKRLLLAVLDNIKNISLMMLNTEIVCNFSNENILLPFDIYLENKDIKDWYNICESIYGIMGKLCFQNKAEEYQVEELNKVLNRMAEKYKDGVLEVLSRKDESLNQKCFRSYREIDNYIENYITMNLVIQKGLKMNPSYFDKGVNFTGIAYGGLELPFLAKDILKGEAYTSTILLKGKYKDRHMSSLQTNTENRLSILGNMPFNEGVNILTDDNVLTGKTLQMALDILFSEGINIDSTVIVRYPSLNRVNQMFFEGHGAIDTTKFFTFIKGLIFPSPYSKIKASETESYLDELGIFNKSRDRILRYLYKNGRYTKDSEVGQLDIDREL